MPKWQHSSLLLVCNNCLFPDVALSKREKSSSSSVEWVRFLQWSAYGVRVFLNTTCAPLQKSDHFAWTTRTEQLIFFYYWAVHLARKFLPLKVEFHHSIGAPLQKHAPVVSEFSSTSATVKILRLNSEQRQSSGFGASGLLKFWTPERISGNSRCWVLYGRLLTWA